MANMSYCRFSNTVSDFRDCLNALWDMGIPVSDDEEAAAENLYSLAKKYVAAYETEVRGRDIL